MVDRITIQVTLKQAGTFLVLLLGGLWGIASLTFGGLSDDVRQIRTDISALSQEDKDVRGLLAGTDTGLRDRINNIHIIVAENKTALASIASDMGEIKDEIKGLRQDFREYFLKNQKP